VVDVLELVEDGRSFQEIIEDFYPDLTAEDIRACVRYAIELAETKEVHISTVRKRFGGPHSKGDAPPTS